MTALGYIGAVNLGLALAMIVLIGFLLCLAGIGLHLKSMRMVGLLRRAFVLSIVMPILVALVRSLVGAGPSPIGFVITAEVGSNRWLLWSGASVWIGWAFAALVSAGIVWAVMVTVVDGLRLRRLIAGTVLRHRIGRVRLFEAAVGAVPLVFVGPSGAAIVVPRGLSPDARRAVLRHEMAHLRSHDATWNWYVMAARLVCAWNPAFWIWQLLHDHATERACDQAVLDRRNVTREVYLSSLLEVARATVRAAPTVRVAAALLGRTTLQMVSFRSRALHIANPSCESGGWRMPGLCTIALAVVLGIAGLTELDVRAWSVQSLHRATQLNLHLNPAGERIHAFGLVMAY